MQLLFNSWEFLLWFLPAVLIGWWVIFQKPHYRLGYLAFMSWLFYVLSTPEGWRVGLLLLPLLLGSTTVDFIAGQVIRREQDANGTENTVLSRRVLIGAMGVNLGLLGIFKYLGFFTASFNEVIGVFTSGGPAIPVADVILPIGISFYTFNSMSYTIDVYRRRVEPARNALDYAAFVALFPHLIAGPIVRYSDIDDQLRSLHTRLTSDMVAVGLWFFIAGLFKKVVIANALAGHVDRLYAQADSLSAVGAWAAALGYTFQLYFDFSAYSDMAVGLAMLMGFRFPINFNSPYKALNPSDFWRRWHISLSRWLTDYLYIELLGGNRGGRWKTLRNLFLTMFLGGLWHGAGWVFVLWGVGWGAALVVHRVAKDNGWTPSSAWVSRAMCFLLALLLWVPFRSGELTILKSGESFTVMANMFAAMFGANGLGIADITRTAASGTLVPATFIGLLAVLLVFVNVAPNTWEVRLRPTRRTAVALAGMATWSLLMLTAPSPFLYFQF